MPPYANKYPDPAEIIKEHPMKKMLAIAAVALVPSLAQAAPFFADDFNANTVGGNKVPTGWSVASGTVDIVGPGYFGGLCNSGGDRCIDLDGSTSNAGVLSHDFTLNAGTTYTAFFDLAGNQRGGSDTMTATFGTSSQAFAFAWNQAWGTYSLAFTPTTSGIYTLSFDHAGGDNVGIILDNVAIQAVPEPESYALLLAGLGVMGAVARRRARAA